MSEHLDKALAAIDAARDLDPNQDVEYIDLLSIARLQAEVAQAAALERIADTLDEFIGEEGILDLIAQRVEDISTIMWDPAAAES
ncbi:MAG: hypothetical protein JWN67_5008 [Actinomycetia bacterium]|nr:hypothetical protein [Actinomycetes bacterium]